MRAFAGLGGITGLLVGACLFATPAAAQNRLSVALDSPIDGPDAPFLVALDKGFYKAENLNVSVEASAGALDAIARVASGAYEIGFADLNALIRYRDANPKTPVKAVLMLYNRPPFAIIARKSRGIAMPKDLEGKKLGVAPTDGTLPQWPIFAKVNGIDLSKITIENVGGPVREPMLMSGQVDAITGSSFTFFVNLKDRGVPPDDLVVMLMADYGVELYGGAIIVNTAFAAQHAEEVRGFLRAYLRGLRETMKAPANAVESIVRRSEGTRKTVELERLQMALRDNVVTAEVKANGLGDIDPTRFDRAIEQLAIAYRFRGGRPKTQDIFDASFLPPAADRKL